MSVAVEGLCWSPRGRASLLKDISFRVEPGVVLGVVGPNGAGKSSLLRCLYRVNRPAAGRVLVSGADIWSLPAREVARKVAVVLQERPAEFALTVREIVEMGRTPHKAPFSRTTAEDDRLVGAALARLGLTSLEARDFGTLSGGEKQRVLLARALAQQPGVLILDEPTNHLDIRHQLDILDLVAGLGITVIAALHDLNLAASHCDRLLVMQHGRVVAEGTAAEVMTEERMASVFNVASTIDRHPGTGAPRLSFHLPPLGAIRPKEACR